jgi:hypothetical protein
VNKSELHNEYEIMLFLAGAICLFFGFFLFFLIATFIKRWNKLSIQRKSETYQKSGNEILFNLLFENITMEEALQRFDTLEKTPLLKRAMTRSIISLHRNYMGEQRNILERFFSLSNLTSFSYKKLKSNQWAEIVEGIRVLSVLNIQEAFDPIKSLLDHPNAYVKKEAFIGLVTLKGLQALEESTLPEIMIDDWTQSCVLYQLKIRSFPSFEGIRLFLQSENDSLVLLAARIVELFQLHDYYPVIVDMQTELLPKYQEGFKTIRDRIIKTMQA